MLKIRIHHTQNRRLAVFPAVKNRARQTPLPAAHQQAHTWIFLGNGGDNLLCSILAVIVNNQYFVADAHRIEYRAHMIQQALEVLGFAQCGNRQCQRIPC